jgi:hypothetical protein
LTWDGLQYDPSQQCIYQQVPQVKVIKPKLVALVVGAHRNLDMFAAIGDYMMLRGRDGWSKDPDAPNWLYPSLVMKNPAQAVTNLVKALVAKPSGEEHEKLIKDRTRFANARLPASELPIDSTAGTLL